jgi:hypothetical protein
MLKDTDLEFTFNGTPGVALVWVIDGECLYDLPLTAEHAEIFLNADTVLDISNDHSEHDGTVVRLMQNGVTSMELMTTEYFGSILQSSPLVLKLSDYPYGRYVVSPYAEFDGEKFIVTNRDVSSLPPYYVN